MLRWEGKVIRKLKFKLGKKDNKEETEEQEQGIEVGEKIIRDLELKYFEKYGKRIFDKSWRNCVIAIILRLTENKNEFKAGEVTKHGSEINKYLGKTGLTPEKTMSATLTTKIVESGLIQRIKNGIYKVTDREKLREIVGMIPEDFPVK